MIRGDECFTPLSYVSIGDGIAKNLASAYNVPSFDIFVVNILVATVGVVTQMNLNARCPFPLKLKDRVALRQILLDCAKDHISVDELRPPSTHCALKSGTRSFPSLFQRSDAHLNSETRWTNAFH